MRHPLPYVAVVSSWVMAIFALGTGLMLLTGSEWALFAVLIVGLLLLIAGVARYRRCDDVGRRKIYVACCLIYFALWGFIVGGAPGSLIGKRIAGDVGEIIGFFITAAIGVYLAIVWGRRWTARHVV